MEVDAIALQSEDKKYKNPFWSIKPVVCVIMIILIVLMNIGLEKGYERDKMAGQPEEQYLDTAEHDTLWLKKSFYDEEEKLYYQIAQVGNKDEARSEFIAFVSQTDFSNVIHYGAPSHYPECYWQGDYTKKDFSGELPDEEYAGNKRLQNVRVYNIEAYKGYMEDDKGQKLKKMAHGAFIIFRLFLSIVIFGLGFLIIKVVPWIGTKVKKHI